MDAFLRFEIPVGVIAFNRDRYALNARFIAWQIVEQFDLEAALLRPTRVHPVEHLAPVLRLGAASARVKL
ncbi:hypothetical protein D3C84_1296640 [compost metagenome]